MNDFNKRLNPYEPVNLKSPGHLLAVCATVLFFVGTPLAAFLSVNQVQPLNNPRTVINRGAINVLGTTGEQYVRNLTPYPNDQDYVKISGNKVAWLNHINGNFSKPELYVTDLSNNSEKRITTSGVNPFGKTAFAIDGNKVVWQWNHDNPSGSIDIFLYDLGANTTRQLTNESCHAVFPSISGDKVVYASDRNNACDLNNYDLYIYDLSTGLERRLTTSPAYIDATEIFSNKIVYEVYSGANRDAYLFDLDTNITTSIAVDFWADDAWPHISGDKIVWGHSQGDNHEIYLNDLSTNTTRNISNNSALQNYPRVSGNKIVWGDYRAGSSNVDVYMFDLATNSTTQITFDLAYQYRADISGDRIVWVDERGGVNNKDIYIYDPPSTQPPSPPTPPPPTADIKANGSDGPITIAYNTAATISWTSSNATSCSVSPTGWSGTSSGGVSTGNLTSSKTYTLTCSGTGGTKTDSVQVSVSNFKKVEICHWTVAGKYEVIIVAEQAALNGHLAHPGDIIPATEGCKPPTIKEVVLPNVLTRKNSSTTNLSKIADPSKVENFTLDTLVNTIKFKEPVDLSSTEILNKLNFLDLYLKADKLGLISLDSKALLVLNKKATLTMKKLPFLKTPRVLVDGKEDKKVVSNIKFSEGVLSFDISHFSTITAAPTVAINEPKANFKTSDTKITLKGSVSDPTATVSAKLNSKDLGSLKVATESGNFTKQIDIAKGLNKISVFAIAGNGATASATVSGTLIEKAGLSLALLLIILLILATSFGAAYFAVKRLKKNPSQPKKTTTSN